MRTTVRIDDDLHRRAKAHAASTGQTIGELMEDALRAALLPKVWKEGERVDLPTYGVGGLLPGIDLSDNSSTLDRLDEGESFGAMR